MPFVFPRRAVVVLIALAAACSSNERSASADNKTARPSKLETRDSKSGSDTSSFEPRASSGASAPAATDDFGDTLPTPHDARRIVSLNPTTTELLFAVGAGSRVVGRTHWDQWPDSAKRVPDLGDGLRPNVEAVLGAHPDLVILYASDDNRPAAARLRAAGISVVAFKIDSIAQFRRATLTLGRLVGDSARARTVVDSVDATLNRVRAATQSLARPKVFIHSWDKPLMTIGGGSFMSQLVEIAGGRNVYGFVAQPSPTVGMEDVVRRDPDIVLAGPIAATTIRGSAAWRALRAVREGHIAVYDTNLVARPSVKLGEAAVSLARLLHPGVLR